MTTMFKQPSLPMWLELANATMMRLIVPSNALKPMCWISLTPNSQSRLQMSSKWSPLLIWTLDLLFLMQKLKLAKFILSLLINWMMLNHRSLIKQDWLIQEKAIWFLLIKSAISLSGIPITSTGVTWMLTAMHEGHRQVLALVILPLTQLLFQATNL